MNKYDQLFNERLGELLKDMDFPLGDISPQWLADKLSMAMPYHTELTLDCSIAEYEAAVRLYEHNGGDYKTPKMPVMFVALNAMMSLAPEQWKITPLRYIEQKHVLIALKAEWDKAAAPYMAEAQKYAQEVARRDTRELEAKGKVKGANGRPLFTQAK